MLNGTPHGSRQTNPAQASINPKTVLLLTSMSDSLSVDRSALKQAGVNNIRKLSSGRQVLELLGACVSSTASSCGNAALKPVAVFKPNCIEYIVCTEMLSDMSWQDFLQGIRSLGATAPAVLLISSANDAQSEGKAIAAGAAVVLARPYTLNTLMAAISQITSARRPLSGTVPSSISIAEQQADSAQHKLSAPENAVAAGMNFARRQQEAGAKLQAAQTASTRAAKLSETSARKAGAFAPASADNKPGQSSTVSIAERANKQQVETPAAISPSELSPLLYSGTGIRLMRAGQLDEAEELLRMAVGYDALDLEACLALAKVRQQQEDEEGMFRWMHRAGMICLSTGQQDRASIIFSRLPESLRNGDHHMIETQNLLEEEAYMEACDSLLELCASQPRTPMHTMLARVCQFTSSPEKHLHYLCAALESKGLNSTASRIRHRLLDEEPEPAYHPSGWLARYPKLHELVAVARFTVQAWKSVA